MRLTDWLTDWLTAWLRVFRVSREVEGGVTNSRRLQQQQQYCFVGGDDDERQGCGLVSMSQCEWYVDDDVDGFERW